MRFTLIILFFLIQLVAALNSRAGLKFPSEKQPSFQSASLTSIAFNHHQEEIEKCPVQESRLFKSRSFRCSPAWLNHTESLLPSANTFHNKVNEPPFLICDHLRKILFPNHNFW